MTSSATPVAKAVVCHSTLYYLRLGRIAQFVNFVIHGFISAGRRYHEGSVHHIGTPVCVEQSRCFELEVEVAEVRQKLKTMETLEKKLELLHRQRAVASEQAAANMNGKRQSSGSVWGWLARTLPPKA
ncbi:hypothetical protein F2Q70_00036098 [Brassica cretica]|uniref:Acyl-CoA-binding domain-containing protein n=1 Tax=Brassica cretica TaxID=69181 RepID=A0A8S9GGE3_BRACR|nr:hypothetical protein F2Q68_00031298 [Brassica cretica]KAF2586295.1 hypothetical protein F2Q70_00036098 [Brassica cretica]